MCVSGRVAEMRALEQRKAYRSQTADGGYSGGNTDRPALQWLLDEFLPTEANAPERPLRQTALSKETTHAHETRLIRVIPRQLGKSQFAQDCVVGPGALAPILIVLVIFQSATIRGALSSKGNL